MQNPNVAIKDRFVEAVFSGDTETLRELIDPSFELHQPDGLPYEGTYNGAEGFLEFLEKFMTSYDLESLDQTALYIEENDPDRLALGFHIKGTLKSNGKQFESPQFETWDFKDGKLVNIRVFWYKIP